MLKISEVYKSYDPQYQNGREVLSGLSLEVEAGESIAIVGPSGSGKTTLLNLIGTLDSPDKGKVDFKGQDITGFSKQDLTDFRNREIGFVFQQHHLLPQCTLLENVLVPTIPLKDQKEKKGLQSRAEELLKRVGIWEQRFQMPGQLSGGECQRAAVVRALINKPALILADEPTGALDSNNSEKLIDLLLEINKTDKVTLIMVTHSAELASRADKVYVLKDGKLGLTKKNK